MENRECNRSNLDPVFIHVLNTSFAFTQKPSRSQPKSVEQRRAPLDVQLKPPLFNNFVFAESAMVLALTRTEAIENALVWTRP